MDSCINIPNYCITTKDKYYVFFNMLKFKEYNENVELSIYHQNPQNLYLIL